MPRTNERDEVVAIIRVRSVTAPATEFAENDFAGLLTHERMMLTKMDMRSPTSRSGPATGVIERAIAVIEEAPFLSAAQKRDILYHNAARFPRLDQTKVVPQ